MGKCPRKHTEKQVQTHDRAEIKRSEVESYRWYVEEMKIESRGLSENCYDV